MLVLSIDPGHTTGIALASGVEATERTFTLLQAGEIAWEDRCKGFKALLTRIAALDEPLCAIVIERFVLYPNEAHNLSYSDFPSVRVIGIVEAYADELGLADKIVLQAASQRKSVQILSEHYEQIKRSKHSRDAYQHLRYFVIMQAQRNRKRG